MSVRTGIQTSHPGCTTPLHSHPYAELLTVKEGRGEAWLDGKEGVVALELSTIDTRRVFGVDRHNQLASFGYQHRSLSDRNLARSFEAVAGAKGSFPSNLPATE